MIYLISNLMKLTLVIPFGITMASLGNSIIKEQTKKRPDKNCRDANSIYSRPYCRCGLIARNCQLRFNCFHNNITLLEGNTYFITKRYFVKNFF